MNTYEVTRYGKQWSVYDRVTRCYVLFGSKKQMTVRARQLNASPEQSYPY